MKLKRNYLTSAELIFITTEMLKEESASAREIMKVGIVAQILCDDLGEYEDCNDIYDKVVASDIDLMEVKNYKDIDVIVNKELSVENFVKNFLVGVENKVAELGKSLDADAQGALIEKLKEVSASGEIIQK